MVKLPTKNFLLAAFLSGAGISHAQHAHLNVGATDGDKVAFKNGSDFAYDFVAGSGYVAKMAESNQGAAAAFYGGKALTYAVTPTALAGTTRQAQTINSTTGAVTYRIPEPITATSNGPAGVRGASAGSFLRMQLLSVELLSGTATSFSFWGALYAYPASNSTTPTAEWSFAGPGEGTLTTAAGTDILDLTAINTRIGDGTTSVFGGTPPTYPNPFNENQEAAGFRWNVSPGEGVDEAVDPYGHIHGRSWSTNAPGDFKVTWQAFDENGGNTDSETLVMKLSARYAATITLEGLNQMYDGDPKEVTASSAVSGSPLVTYDGGETAPTDPGSYAIVATLETATHRGSTTGTLVIEKADQVITFRPPSGAPRAGDTITLSANSTVDSLVVGYAVVSGNASLKGDKLTLNDGNPVVVEASQPGNEFFNAADSVQLTIDPGLRSQTITLSGLRGTHFLSGSPVRFSVSSTSGGSVAVSVTGPARLQGNQLLLTGVGQVTVKAMQDGNSIYASATRTRLLTVKDNEAPEVSLAATVQSRSDITSVRCRVSDNDQVKAIEYQVNGPSANSFGRKLKVKPAGNGNTNLRIRTEEKGQYLVRVRAFDPSGNGSSSRVIAINRK